MRLKIWDSLVSGDVLIRFPTLKRSMQLTITDVIKHPGGIVAFVHYRSEDGALGIFGRHSHAALRLLYRAGKVRY